MSIKRNEPSTSNDLSENETFFSYYIRQRKMWISLLLSMFLLLDIVTLFVITNYSFTEIFLYFGILMVFIAGGALVFIYLEENYFWGIIGSLILGVMPIIETIIILARTLTGSDLILGILTLVIGVLLSILPMLLIYLKFRLRNK